MVTPGQHAPPPVNESRPFYPKKGKKTVSTVLTVEICALQRVNILTMKQRSKIEPDHQNLGIGSISLSFSWGSTSFKFNQEEGQICYKPKTIPTFISKLSPYAQTSLCKERRLLCLLSPPPSKTASFFHLPMVSVLASAQPCCCCRSSADGRQIHGVCRQSREAPTAPKGRCSPGA